MRRFLFAISVLCCVTVVVPSMRVSAANDGPRHGGLRVLLVGNSYTRFNLLPELLQRVADSIGGPTMDVSALARGGYTLRRHLRLSGVKRVISQGHFSHVVLQGHSLRPIDRAEEFSAAVTEFHGLIESAGAHTVLYETWARRAGASFYRQRPQWRGPAQMQAHIGSMYRGLARELGVTMAPVGSAFLLAGDEDASALYRADGAHPSMGGSYLAACVLYGAISGADPRAVTYRPNELSKLQAAELRSLAAVVLMAERRGTASPPERPITALDVAQVVTGLATGAPLPSDAIPAQPAQRVAVSR